MSKQYTLTVVDKIGETQDTVTIKFKQPALRKVKYKSGQYLTLQFRINGRKYLRPYSFSSAPGIDATLDVTVKRVLGGVVSNHVCDQVKVGDVIEVMEPMGDFILPDPILKEHHIVLWGAGSGVTPLFSLAKWLLHHTTNKVTLVYGNRSMESVIFLEAIKALQAKHTDRFTTWHFHTKLVVEAAHPTIIQGRIAPQKVLQIMQAEGDIQQSLHYICGPAGLKESVKQALVPLQVSSANIFTEDFELVKDEALLEDVITREVSIAMQGTATLVEVTKGKSILEAGLDAGLELAYSCQTGNCSICKGTLLLGDVRQIMKKHPDLKEEEYQLCCTFPITNNVQIAI